MEIIEDIIMKKIIVLLPALFIIGYSTAQETIVNDLCPPTKNYLHINHKLIDDYLEQVKNNEIKSIFFDNSQMVESDDVLQTIQHSNLSFVEKKLKLNNEKDYSLYKLETFSSNNSVCNYAGRSGNEDNCYKVTPIDIVKSKYAVVSKKTGDLSFERKFINLKTNEVLYEYAYTKYKLNKDSLGLTWCQINPEPVYTDLIILNSTP